MTATTQAAPRFNRPDFGYCDQPEVSRKTIASLAPRGMIYAVVRVLLNGHRRMRLYGLTSGRLTGIDGLLGRGLFDELIAGQHFDADKIDYNGFDRTDGTDGHGFGWPADVRSNVALGIIYGLAEIVHGDRNAWSVSFL